MTTFDSSSYSIPLHNVDYLSKKIEKLNKVCRKLGLALITLDFSEVFTKEVKPARFIDGVQKPAEFMEFRTAVLHGEAPQLAGWTFVGKREPLEGSSLILGKSIPGQSIPVEYQDDHALTCDHCNKRARRNETFIVSNGTKFMEVGRSCLKDFLGHENPNTYANYADALYNIESELARMVDEDFCGGGSSYSMPLYSIMDTVAPLVHVIKHKGFISKQFANDDNTPTAHILANHLNPGPCPRGISSTEWFKINNIPFTEDDVEVAKAVIAWVATNTNTSEFFTVVKKLFSVSAVSLKMSGYMAAAVNMYLKEIGEAAIRVSIKADMVNTPLATEGTKVEFTATVLTLHSFMSNGPFACVKYIIMMKTTSGHLVKMFTTSGDSGVQVGADVVVKGKIGSFEEETFEKSKFRGIMVTTMAPRARINSVN